MSAGKNKQKKAGKQRSLTWYFILFCLLLVIVAALFLMKSLFFTKPIRHILLISIDTCRADYLSCYGFPQKLTPTIDAIAEDATLFENVVTSIPLTLPAHSSMMTGTIPPYHGVHDNLNEALGESNITLAEILKENGFTTGAVVSTIVLNSRFGLNQGFDTYNDEFENPIRTTAITERRGDEATHFAIEWLKKHQDEKFFMFLHYYDPHHPYDPPEPFKSSYQDNLYAGEIAYTDFCIEKVINKLKELGLYDSTLIIITGDHGEMLGEHGEATHGYFIYQSAIKVPLIFKLPGQTRPRRINHIVGLIDIVPTICSLLGIKPPPHIQGIDLSPYLKGHQPKVGDRYIFCESLTATKYNGNSLLGVVTDQYKYIQTTRPELYNLLNDPKETENLLPTQPHRARLLQDKLQQILEQSVRGGAGAQVKLDEHTLESLKSLGYVGGQVDADFTFDQTKDDPKDLLTYHKKVAQVQTLIFREEYDQAKKLCEKLLAQRPDVAQMQYNMATIFIKQNDYAAAIPYLQKVIELNPDNFHALKDLADALELQGQHQQAIEHYLQVLQLKPDYAEAHYNLAKVLGEQGKPQEAISHYRRALEIRPKYAKAHNNLGSALAEQGKLNEAIEHFTRALQINPNFADAQRNLGNTLLQQGEIDKAIDNFTKAVELDPNCAQTRYTLSRALIAEGRIDEAITQLKETLRLKPDWVNPMNSLAWLLATCNDDSFRNGQEAIALAERACQLTDYKDPAILDTLAAAYATAGNFSDAVATAEQALKLALANNHKQWAEEIKARLKLYKRNQSYLAYRQTGNDLSPSQER